MGLFDRFPWVNTHQLNLDWIIQKMKEWGADAAENVAKAETAAENAAANAAAAVAGVAERAESAADRAETAKSAAEMAQNSANISANRAVSYYQQARDAATAAEGQATNAEASATEASRIESIVEGYAQDCNSASASAQASATAAAKSAQEAATAGFAYGNFDRGFAYKTLDSVDSRTGNNKEYLSSPLFYIASGSGGEMVRVTGAGVYLFGENAGQSDVSWHYEKLYMISLVDGETSVSILEDTTPKHLRPYRVESIAWVEYYDAENTSISNVPYCFVSNTDNSSVVQEGSVYYTNDSLHITTQDVSSSYVRVFVRVYFTETGLG